MWTKKGQVCFWMQVGKIMREADIILYASSYSIGPIYNARVMSDVNVLVRV